MMERTPFSVSDITISRLHQNIPGFSCGCEDIYEPLNRLFAEEIELCEKYKYLSAYQVVIKSTGELAAIFAVANDALPLTREEEREDFKDEISPRLDKEGRYLLEQIKSFPAINITHLGVREQYQRNGLGSLIIKYIIATYSIYSASGCQFITVDALNNPSTNKFYSRHGFSYLTNSDFYNSTRRMYYPLFL